MPWLILLLKIVAWPKPACRCPGLVTPRLVLLAGLLAWSGVAIAQDVDRWWVCTDAAALANQLSPIAERIADRVDQIRADVRVSAAALGEGSTEYLIASTADVFEQLRVELSIKKVPLRRVDFRWLSASAAINVDQAATCRGVVVFVEMMSDLP